MPPFLRLFELAQGGMGRVDLVVRRDSGFERLYVAKRLLAAHVEDELLRKLFLDEARIAGLVHHANVVAVLDVGEDEEGPYLVMDYVEGVSLAQLVRDAQVDKRRLPVQLCVRIALQTALGLHAAHELATADGRVLHVVHRDVSPQNVMVGYDGIVKVTDFGIAKALGQSTRTATGMIKGKLGYMSPEQLRYEELDRRSDLFSLGVVLFELLSGERLYRNTDGMDGVRRILDEPPPDIGERRDDVPPPLVELTFELLAKKRDSRPATALDVAHRLEAVLAELVAAEGAIDLGAYVSEVFTARRDAERARVAEALRPRAADHATAKTAASIVATAGPAAPAPRARVAWAVAIAAVAGMIAVFAWRAGTTATNDGAMTSAAPAAPSTVRIRIESEPDHAAVRLAGEPRGVTPVDVTLPRGDRPVTIAIELEGHAMIEREIVPDNDETLHLVLTPSAAAAPPPAASPPAKASRPPPRPPARRATEAPAASSPVFRRFD